MHVRLAIQARVRAYIIARVCTWPLDVDEKQDQAVFKTIVASIFDIDGSPMSRRLKDFLSHIACSQTQPAGQRYSCDVDVES